MSSLTWLSVETRASEGNDHQVSLTVDKELVDPRNTHQWGHVILSKVMLKGWGWRRGLIAARGAPAQISVVSCVWT